MPGAMGSVKTVARRLTAVATAMTAVLSSEASAQGFWTRALVPGAEMAERASREGDLYALASQDLAIARLWPRGATQGAVLNAYQRSLALRPDDPHTLASAAEVLESLGDHPQAEALARRSLEIDPEHPEAPQAWFALALAYTRRRRHDLARDAYLGALRFPARSEFRALLLCNMAEEYGSLRDLATAEETFHQCLALDTGNPLGWLGLAVVRDRGGNDPTEAVDHAIDAAPDDSLVSILRRPGVFFVPAYDVYWYEALALEGIARRGSPAAGQRALTAWSEWLARAERDDPWRSVATARRQRAAGGSGAVTSRLVTPFARPGR